MSRRKSQFNRSKTLPMVFTIDTTLTAATASDQYAPTISTVIDLDIEVDWGDGMVESFTGVQSSGVVHTYAAPGIYEVKILSKNTNTVWWDRGNSIHPTDQLKITNISDFGTTRIPADSQFAPFISCENMTITAENTYEAVIKDVEDVGSVFRGCKSVVTIPNLGDWDMSHVTNIASMFQSCTLFNDPGVSNWDVSNVTNFYNVFTICENFNQPLNNWDVSKGTNFARMFLSAYSFNQPLNNWDVSNAETLAIMFQNATAFNQPLNDWDVSSVTNMQDMFAFADAFNQDLDNWDVSNATTMEGMFQNAYAFNQPLNNWDVRNCNNFSSMFQGATAFNSSLAGWQLGTLTSGANCRFMFQEGIFNQPINDWDVSQVSDLNSIFYQNTAFNQPLNTWDVRNCKDFSRMFRQCNTFNSSLSGWELGTLTSDVKTNDMFYLASSFNQPINDWDTSQVVSMRLMFYNAYNFNQDLNNWDFSNVTNLINFFSSCPLSVSRYDALLVSLDAQTLQPNLTVGVDGLEYTAAGAGGTARANIISGDGWTFDGDTGI